MIKNVFIFIIFVGIGIAIVWYIKPVSEKRVSETIPSEKIFPPIALKDAPTDSIDGTIKSLSGTVLWQSRVASDSAVLNPSAIVQQGEIIETKNDGFVEIIFDKLVQVILSAETRVNFAQTLPEHIVLNQEMGTVHYISSENSSVSVRSRHVLMKLSTNADISISSEEGIITVVVSKGSVMMAYNDLENLSTVVTIKEGSKYVFDDSLRSGELE